VTGATGYETCVTCGASFYSGGGCLACYESATKSNSFLAPLEKRIEALEKAVAKLVDQHEPQRCHLATPEWVAKLKAQAGSGDSLEDGTLRQQCENNSSVENPHRPGENVNEGSGKVPTPQPAAPEPSLIHDAFERARIDRARALGAEGNDPALEHQPYQPPVDSEGETVRDVFARKLALLMTQRNVHAMGNLCSAIMQVFGDAETSIRADERGKLGDAWEREERVVGDLRTKLEAAERERDDARAMAKQCAKTRAEYQKERDEARSELGRALAAVEAAKDLAHGWGARCDYGEGPLCDMTHRHSNELQVVLRAFDAKGDT